MEEVYVGKTFSGESIAIPNRVRAGHVQIVGATGRGKTESVIVPWVLQDTIAGEVSILIDGKGDRGILQKLEQAYERAGLDREKLAWLDLGDIEGSYVTNPLLYGSPQQVTDRIFSTFTFENEYFKAVSQEAALLVVRMLKGAKEVPTFQRIYELLRSDAGLTELAARLPEEDAKACARGLERYLTQATTARLEKFSGLLSQLAPFAEGELADLVNASGKEERFFSLTETISPWIHFHAQHRYTVVILLPQLLYQEAAAKLGKMLLQEIAWAVGHKEQNGYRGFTSLFLDEFGSFVYPGFIGLLNKARSTNTAIHLSHQSLGDLEAVSEGFAAALHTNTNVKCILGVNDPTTADFFAKHFGTRKSEKSTERAEKTGWWGKSERTGDLSLRDVDVYRIDPNNLRHYSQGKGALSMIIDGHVIAEEVQFARAPF